MLKKFIQCSVMLLAVSIAVLIQLVVGESSGEGSDWTGARLPPFLTNGKDRLLPNYAPTFSRHTPFLTEDSLPEPVYGRFGGGTNRGFKLSSNPGSEQPEPVRFSEKREFSEPFSGPQGETEQRPSEFLPPRFGAAGRIPRPEYFREKEGPSRGGDDRNGFPELGKPYYPEYFRPEGSEGIDGFRPRISEKSNGSPDGFKQRIIPNYSSDGPHEHPNGFRQRNNVPSSSSVEEGPRQRFSGTEESTQPLYRPEISNEGPRGFRPSPESFQSRFSEGEGFPQSPIVTPHPNYHPLDSFNSQNQPFRGPKLPQNPNLGERSQSLSAPERPQSRPVRPTDTLDQSASHPENPGPAPPHGGDVELSGDKSRSDRLFAIRLPEFPPIPAPPPYPSLSPRVTSTIPTPMPGAYHFGTTAPPENSVPKESLNNQTESSAGKSLVPVYSPLSGPFPGQNSEALVPTAPPSLPPANSQVPQFQKLDVEPQQPPAPVNQSSPTEPPKQKPQGLPSSFRSFFPPGFGPFDKGADEVKSKQ